MLTILRGNIWDRESPGTEAFEEEINDQIASAALSLYELIRLIRVGAPRSHTTYKHYIIVTHWTLNLYWISTVQADLVKTKGARDIPYAHVYRSSKSLTNTRLLQLFAKVSFNIVESSSRKPLRSQKLLLEQLRLLSQRDLLSLAKNFVMGELMRALPETPPSYDYICCCHNQNRRKKTK